MHINSFNDKQFPNDSATFLPWYDCVSFVNKSSISVVTSSNQHLINQSIGVHSCPFVVRRFPLWIPHIGPSWLSLLDNPLHWFQASRAPAPHDERIIRERNRGPGWRIGSTEGCQLPSASHFVCLGRPSCLFVDSSFYSVACSAKPGCFRQFAPRSLAAALISNGRTPHQPPHWSGIGERLTYPRMVE